jgi:hypothetical protein
MNTGNATGVGPFGRLSFAGCAGLQPLVAVPKAFGENESLLQFDFIASAGRSAEFCPAHLRAKHFGSSRAESNSPAPVETDRRPENSRSISRFAVDNAPALLRERPCNPTAQQQAAEGELIMGQAKFREKTRGARAFQN